MNNKKTPNQIMKGAFTLQVQNTADNKAITGILPRRYKILQGFIKVFCAEAIST
jgi:hypothetical protein